MISREKIEAVWYSKASNDELQELLGITEYQLWMAKRFYDLPRRPSVPSGDDPDEETIAERCREVQAGWTPEERERRYVGRRSSPTTRSYLFTPTGLFVEAGPHL